MFTLESGMSQGEAPGNNIKVLDLHAKTEAVSASFTKAEVAEIVAKQNNPNTFRNILSGPGTISSIETESAEVVTLMEPTAPYGIGVMVVAGHEYKDDEPVQTKTIYDFSEKAQRLYWAKGLHALTSIEAFIDKQERHGVSRALMTENCISTISTADHQTSRSIALPHAQIFMTDSNRLRPLQDEVVEFRQNLELEQRILRKERVINKFLSQVQAEVSEKTGRHLAEPSLRDAQPFGYSFTPSRTNDIRELTGAMSVHHTAYTQAIKRYEADFAHIQRKYGLDIIPQLYLSTR